MGVRGEMLTCLWPTIDSVAVSLNIGTIAASLNIGTITVSLNMSAIAISPNIGTIVVSLNAGIIVISPNIVPAIASVRWGAVDCAMRWVHYIHRRGGWNSNSIDKSGSQDSRNNGSYHYANSTNQSYFDLNIDFAALIHVLICRRMIFVYYR